MINHFISLRTVRIAAIADVTPALRRFTLAGDELGAFVGNGIACPALASCSFDDHVKVFFEREGELVLPTQDEGHLDWPDDAEPTARDYTIRSHDAVAGTLDLEVLVDHDGPGGTWGRDAAVGDVVRIAGPPYSLTHPVGATSMLLVGDDTALPAIARCFEEAGESADIRAIVIVGPDQAEYPLPRDRTTMVVRNGDDQAIALGPLLSAAWAEREPGFVWGALEYTATRDLRRELKLLGVGRDRSYVAHYWRRDQADRAASLHEAHETLGALTDMMTPWAVRVAATLGIADAIADGATDDTQIAASAGADRTAIGTLMGLLCMKGVFTRSDHGYALTPVSELLLDGDEHRWREHLHLDSAAGYMDASLAGMRLAVETGQAGFDQLHGKSFWDALSEDPERGAQFDAHLEGWVHEWSPQVVADPVWDGAKHVVDIGGGSGALAIALLERHAHLDVTIVELPDTAGRAHERLVERGLTDRGSVTAQSFFDPLPTGADTYVLAQVLHDWPDAEARRILQRAAEALPPGGRLVIAERVGDDAEDGAFMSLLMLTLFGSRERSTEDFQALLLTAGLRATAVRSTGPFGLIVAELAATSTP